MRSVQRVAAILVLPLVLSGCASAEDRDQQKGQKTTSATGSASPSGKPSPLDSANPVIEPVPLRQWQAMKRAGMVRPGCPIVRRGQLRSVRVGFVDFEGVKKRGQLVVNRDVAASVARIFSVLYDARFPIRKMRPVEKYDGDANASLADDNTSAYNCRTADQINAPFRESPHANGRAIDINPFENPWKDLRCKCWFPSDENRARKEGPGVIVRGGVVWKAFRQEGWIWQDIDVPDYMHFDTGYPSKPFPSDPDVG